METTGDYTHTLHAGNVGDVLKHHLLGLVLQRWAAGASGPLRYVESHAGQGQYELGSTGEWTEGVGRLLPEGGQGPGSPLATALSGPWLELVRRHNSSAGSALRHYPGSPRIAAALLARPEDRLLFCELDGPPQQRLAALLTADRRATVLRQDGFAATPALLNPGPADPRATEALLFLDPPYSDRQDWQRVAETMIAARRSQPAARIVCWYPVKSLVRPNGLQGALRQAGIGGVVVELLTKPLDLKKKQLNGSGMLLIDPPAGVLPQAAAALPLLGEACSAAGGWYSARIVRW